MKEKRKETNLKKVIYILICKYYSTTTLQDIWKVICLYSLILKMFNFYMCLCYFNTLTYMSIFKLCLIYVVIYSQCNIFEFLKYLAFWGQDEISILSRLACYKILCREIDIKWPRMKNDMVYWFNDSKNMKGIAVYDVIILGMMSKSKKFGAEGRNLPSI